MKAPVRVAVTGAAGQIAYALVFRIASGAMLGADQPVILQLLEITPALKALSGVALELEDCAFPLLAGMVLTDDPAVAFRDVDYALLVGAKPRGPGMERSDLLAQNGGIFRIQGRALNEHASREVRVVVVGNPANTNALTALHNAPDLAPHCFSALTRLDHNRARAQLAGKLAVPITEVRKLCIWGNHSTTQYPDLAHALVGGAAAPGLVDRDWYVNDYIPRVAKRGAEIIDARGASSAASAANAVVDHIHDWALGSAADDFISMAVPSDGSYDIPAGVIYSYPVVTRNNHYEIVQGLPVDEFSRERMTLSLRELEEERAGVQHLFNA